jgi:hypothetical protein
MQILKALLGTIILIAPTIVLAAPPPLTPAVRSACSPDARRLCAAVLRNETARRACMLKHRDQWSEACTKAVAEMRRGKR